MTPDVLIVSRGPISTGNKHISDACKTASPSAVEFDPRTPGSAEGDREARVVVGHLADGDRRIPDDVASAWQVTDRRASIALITEEPLTRPVVSLYRGKVQVLSGRSSPEILGRQLARLARGTVPTKLESSEQLIQAPREVWGPGYWAATTPGQEFRGLLVLEKRKNGLVAAAVPDTSLQDEEVIENIVHLSLNESLPLATCLGMLRGHGLTIALDSTGARWHFAGSAPDARMVLASPRRLPRVFEMSTEIDEELVFEAASGDVLIVIDRNCEGADMAIERALQSGGAEVLHFLQARPQETPCSLVVEAM